MVSVWQVYSTRWGVVSELLLGWCTNFPFSLVPFPFLSPFLPPPLRRLLLPLPPPEKIRHRDPPVVAVPWEGRVRGGQGEREGGRRRGKRTLGRPGVTYSHLSHRDRMIDTLHRCYTRTLYLGCEGCPWDDLLSCSTPTKPLCSSDSAFEQRPARP